jgi:hypothetical protein
MNKFIILLSIYFLSSSLEAYDLSLVEGKSRKEIPKNLLKIIYNKYSTLPGYLYEYSPDKYYSLSKTGNAIGVFDLTNINDILSGWPLTRWEHLWIPKEKKQAYYDAGMIDYVIGKPNIVSSNPGVGCLNNAPLRYGKLAEQEEILFLFLNDQMQIFSPMYQKVVFAEYYDNSDWETEVSGNKRRQTLQFDSDDQYISMLVVGARDSAYPGVRSYAKLYVGDYDQDGNEDIVVWRKVFLSNKKSNSQKGFTFLRNEYAHFERDLVTQNNSEVGETGEYLPQDDTSEATVQGWLTTKNQTWQSGFPSKSECAGQEGQLIPEMHDPLLNDPDVLK